MNPIQVVYIGSTLGPESDAVVRAGVAWARAAGARPVVVHALAMEPLFGSEMGVLVPSAAVESWKNDQTMALLAQARRHGALDLPDSDILLRHGPPHEVLAEAAAEPGALLVVGPNRGGRLHPWLLGSTAERLLQRSRCPVLVVRGDLPVPLLRVLAPVDLSPGSEGAFRQGLAMLEQLRSPDLVAEALFVLTHEQREEGLQLSSAQMDRAAAHELRHFMARAGDRGLGVRRKVMVGEPVEQILARAAEWDAHLIVLGRHELSRFDRLMLGSVSSTVVRRAPVSVLVLPEAAAPAIDVRQLERAVGSDMFYFG
jgi:nucleotide-binding universal stress UspA family protein